MKTTVKHLAIKYEVSDSYIKRLLYRLEPRDKYVYLEKNRLYFTKDGIDYFEEKLGNRQENSKVKSNDTIVYSADTLSQEKKIIELLESQISFLKDELENKNKQIEQLNDSTIQLQKLLNQQQQLHLSIQNSTVKQLENKKNRWFKNRFNKFR